MFSGGLVEPDRQRNAEGDRSARLFRVIAGPSGDGEVQVRGTCAALPARAGSAGRWSVFVALCALLARRSGSLHRLRRK
jgi:hypothetical protein